jgi:hypothetical protein
MSASLTPVESPTAVTSWRDQIERLSEHASPCRYLAPAKWAAIRANALSFLDQYGAEAHRLGWTDPERSACIQRAARCAWIPAAC